MSTGTPDVVHFGRKIIYTKTLKTIKFTLKDNGGPRDITTHTITINSGPTGAAPTITKTGNITDGSGGVFQVDYAVSDYTQTVLTIVPVQVFDDSGTGKKLVGEGEYELRPSILA